MRFGIPGKLDPLIAGNVRQMLSVLNTYIALLLAIAGCACRFFFRAPDAAAYPIFALQIALALRTYAQCLFGLDTGSALTLWQIVLAKDIAYLAILVILKLAAGLTSGLTALAIGHSRRRHTVHRYAFARGSRCCRIRSIALKLSD